MQFILQSFFHVALNFIAVSDPSWPCSGSIWFGNREVNN